MLSVKTPQVQTSGVFFRLLKYPLIIGLGLYCAAVAADCPASRIHEVATIKQIYDGDTLRLLDGRRLRVIGINTPEMGDQHRRAEPQAQAATGATSAFFSDGRVHLAFDEQRQDRYGRLLAHAYNENGHSLAAHLLERGLAFHIGVPPNLMGADCLMRHEQAARNQQKGIWNDSFWAPRVASTLTSSDTGFRRVTGKVTNISGRKDIWVELDGALVLKISAADKPNFKTHPWRHWQGKNLEVVGWLVNRQQSAAAKQGFKPLVLQVRTPSAIRVLPATAD